MESYSNFVYGLTSAFSWTGMNVGLALLHQVPTSVASNLAPSVSNLVVLPGFQELAAPGYTRNVQPVNQVVVLPLVQVVMGTDFAVTITQKSYVAAGVFYLVSPTGTVTNKALTSNVATLTTGTAHGFTTGQTVLVAGVGAPFDGSYTIASTPTGTTFTYAKTNANITSAAAAGTATITFSGVVNPWLFVTDVCFDTVVTPGSRVSALGSPRVLFSYAIQGTAIIPAQGKIVQAPGPQEWEPSRMYHVYLYPERLNWLPNPSFEDVGNFGWRANGTMTRTTPGVDKPANHFLRVAGNRLEGIPVATSSAQHRLSCYIKAAPTGGATWVQLGLSCWDELWSAQQDVLGPQRGISDAWSLLDNVIQPYENSAGLSFLLMSNGSFDIDLAMMSNIPDLNAYFDGDSETGAVGDFSWQGVPHQSYSCWYNNRFLVGARIFGEYVEGQVLKRGLIYDWIPQDAAIATHWDVISPTDTKHPPKDWASRTIP